MKSYKYANVHQINNYLQVEFPAGEIVRMKHECQGLDANGKLIMNSYLEGYVPEVDLDTQIDIKVHL